MVMAKDRSWDLSLVSAQDLFRTKTSSTEPPRKTRLCPRKPKAVS